MASADGVAKRAADRVEFGDFQTPVRLATDVCALLAHRRNVPNGILEPSCGRGSLLAAAARAFPRASVVGVDINQDHVAEARARLARERPAGATVLAADFFTADWAAILRALPDPLLVVGNPPWVTSSTLGAIDGRNSPPKSNAQRLPGIEALTGRSNFDISEWMMRRMLEWLDARSGTLAMLCKTTVARKILERAWNDGVPIDRAELHRIDAMEHFGAAVDACLLVCDVGSGSASRACAVFDRLGGPAGGSYGYIDGRLIADAGRYRRTRHLAARSPGRLRWRSGIKHDCSAVLELRVEGRSLVNGLGENADVEPDVVAPLCKASDLAGRPSTTRQRYLLIPQRAVGEDTTRLRTAAPKAWAYLMAHREAFDSRRSAIYRGRPPFAIFGVGPYSFARWKVAIPALHKALAFSLVGPIDGKPVVLDDTTYFLPCRTKGEARLVADLLASEAAVDFYASQVFWDAKRPITIDLLGRLDLRRLADANARGVELARWAGPQESIRCGLYNR